MRAPKPVDVGEHEVAVEFIADVEHQPGTGGIGRLAVDGRTVAEGRVEHTVPGRFSPTETFDVGMDLRKPGHRRLRFTSNIHRHHPRRHRATDRRRNHPLKAGRRRRVVSAPNDVKWIDLLFVARCSLSDDEAPTRSMRGCTSIRH